MPQHVFAQSCGSKPQGDADCNSKIDLIDFETWRREFLKQSTTKQSDFNSDTKIDLIDYESWRRTFMNGGATGGSPTPTIPPPVSNVDINQYIVPGNNGGTTPISAAGEGPFGTGNFRIICNFSHLNFDDPIVYQGQQNKSHLHFFFGNTLADYASTYEQLRASGDSTCHGRLVNRTAYWTPAIINGAGKVVIPEDIAVYYKSAGRDPLQVQNMPEGLKMIAGFNMNNPSSADIHSWYCESTQDAALKTKTIPTNCASSELVVANLVFPDCWNGRDLDSTDHRSHISYAVRDNLGREVCPASHPVELPEVAYSLFFRNSPDVSTWYAASDKHGGANYANGQSFHGDWFGAWDRTVMTKWINTCVHGKLDCKDGQLGDNTSLIRGINYGGPFLVSPPAMNMAGMLH